MKHLLILSLLLILPALLVAQIGVGIIIGQPTGLSLKHWTSDTNAFDAALAWSFESNEAFYVHVNYLFHRDANLDNLTIPWFWGIGANLRTWEKKNDTETRFAVRMPIGLNFKFERSPTELFLELAPSLDLVPATKFRMGAAIGFRFYFN